MGWGLSLPVIERRGPLGGPPEYDNPPVEPSSGTIYPYIWTARTTRFTFNGEPLVPICEVQSSYHPCTSIDGGAMPDWVWKGWIYFRLENDNSSARFFWSPNRKTWRVQFRGGEMLELGTAIVQAIPGPDDEGIDFDQRFGTLPSVPGLLVLSDIYRWNLVRRFDPTEVGRDPRNVVVYRWAKLGETGRNYLTDIYYTPLVNPAADIIPLEDYAHHLRLAWQRPIQIRNAYPPIWKAPPDHHLIRIDVTSKPYADARAPRELVRRHHLVYDNHGHRSFLTHFQVEGRCAAPILEVAEVLPTTVCPRLPATRLRYSELQANRILRSIFVMPPISLRPGRKSLDFVPLDVNADSIPDLIETDPQHTSYDGSGSPPRRMLMHNGTWYVEGQITGSANYFSHVGYSVTGDFTFTGETGLWWYLPGRWHPEMLSRGPDTQVPRLGPDGWKWSPIAPWVSFSASPFIEPGYPIWSLKLIGDINGDGLQDLINYPDTDGPGMVGTVTGQWGEPATGVTSGWVSPGPPSDWKVNAQIGSFIARRKGKGPLNWQPHNSCMGPSVADMEGHWPDGSQSVHLADMNGDSLADVVVISPTRVRYWPSDGRGHFTACRGVGCMCTTATTSALSNSMLSHDLGPNPSSRNLLLADVNGDGYADLVSWDRTHLRVAFNNDGWFFREPITIEAFWLGSGLGSDWSASFDDNAVAVSVADMNGNGINDLVISSGASMVSLDLHRLISVIATFAPDAYASRPDLLIEIDNGYGARTQIAYESTADITRYSLNTPDAWPEPLPQVMHVVQRLTTKTDVPGTEPISTYYSYHDPAWDGWERRIRGFRKVTVSRGGDRQVTTEQTYFIPSCPDRFCGSTDETFNRLRAVSSYPLVTETRDNYKRYLSTVSYSYEVMDIMKGLDGRWVRTSHATRIDTRLYDTHDWKPVNATADQVISLKGREPTPLWTGRVPVRTNNNVLLRTTMETDDYGNLVQRTDHGRIQDNGDPIDDAVVTNIIMDPPRSDWRFLPQRIHTEPIAARPGVPTDRARIVLFDYDDAGRLTASRAILTGTLPLDRHHEDVVAAIAPLPLGAAVDTVVPLAGYHYDDFDNIVRVEAPAGICIAFSYDPDYAQLSEIQTVYRDGCGTDTISQRFSWDRGLERILGITNPTGMIATAAYDSYGRIAEARLPAPSSGPPATEPTVTIQYLDQAGGPIQRKRVERQLGPGKTYVSWVYSDGLGRELLNLHQADPAAGDGGAWLVSGLPQLSKDGVVTGVYTPWFYSGDPAMHPLTAPTTPLTRVTLDSFGRPFEMWRPDGTLAGRQIYRPLLSEHTNAAGRWSSVRVNGHARLIEERTRTNQTETIVTFDYLVGGEPARMVKEGISNPPTAHPTRVVRWMQYDSLGRMVLNAEPNTSSGFNADPASAAGLRAWRYAYNSAGQLVGTSDARGCGWNLHYDRLGRLIAKDLSPCLRAQAAYSAPNLTNGSGTEVFNIYDAPESGQTSDFGASSQFLVGRLVSTRDRAAHTRFAYDRRGRLVGLARRLARPADTDAVWPDPQDINARYSNDWFRSAVEYDDANRAIRAITGAQAAELLNEGKSEITFGYSNRGLLYQIGGSYGTLLAEATYDALDRPLMSRLGDAASTLLTTTYSQAGNVATFRATRSPPLIWTQPTAGYTPPGLNEPPSTQTILEDVVYHINNTSQIVRIDDLRPPFAWPTGAKPASRVFQHDLLGRLTRVDYHYSPGPDPFVGSAGPTTAIPHAQMSHRPGFQVFTFDPLGNRRSSSDDANALFDRSVGSVIGGSPDVGPDQITSAAEGKIDARYDASGNLASLTVRRSICADPVGRCMHRFIYDWDETGKLARARRWDYAEIPSDEPTYPAVPAGNTAADLRYRYDTFGLRRLRSSFVSSNGVKHSAWPLPLLRLDGTEYDAPSNKYARNSHTEEIVLPGIRGRVVHRTGLPGLSPQHVLLHIHDHLGSVSLVIDKATSELVERASYLPYGNSESDYRPPRWRGLAARERFTGKENDSEVGLIYFGARYYFPILGQWISADPLAIHGLASGSNPYAYVSGKVMQAVDPDGLQPCIGREDCRPFGNFTVGGFQIGFGGPGGSGPSGIEGQGPVGAGVMPPGSLGGPRRSQPSPPVAISPANSGSVLLWYGIGSPATYPSAVDPAVIEGFNAGVRKHEVALVGTGLVAGISSALVGEVAAFEAGTAMLAWGQATLQNLGAAVFVQTGRVAAWFTELSLAEQGVMVSASGGAPILYEARAFEGAGGADPRLALLGAEVERTFIEAYGARKVVEDFLLAEGAIKPPIMYTDAKLLSVLSDLSFRGNQNAKSTWQYFTRVLEAHERAAYDQWNARVNRIFR
jgi:RHS repeat-associated protein